MACKNGKKDMVEILVSANANIDITDNNLNTPLMIAASVGHLEIVQFLVAKGCNVMASNKKNLTASRLAEMNQHYNVVEFLNNNKNK